MFLTCKQLTECERATLIYNNRMDIKIKIEVMSVGRIKLDFELAKV